MANYLVTGGSGFIGSHIVDALLARGDSVRVLDNFSTGKRANLAQAMECHGDRLEIVEGDICDSKTVSSAVTGIEFVLHQAALPSVPRSVADPVASNHVNVTGTLTVLNAARQAGVKRLVCASSSSVYGDSDVLPKVETMTPRPLSPYAVSKLAGEHYCQVFWRVYGLATVCLRYFNVFGPRQDPESPYAAVIPKFIRAALAGEPVTIHGDGLQSRDFTYVDNVVLGNLLACEAEAVAGKVLNVSCGSRHTLLDMVNALEALIEHDIEIRYAEPRTGDVKHSQADIAAIRSMTGYEPKVDFRSGLRHTFGWHLEPSNSKIGT